MTRYTFSVMCISLMFLSFSAKSVFSSITCECDFDTTKYSAKCSCSTVCSVTTKNGKKCKITCNGESTSKAGDTKLYGYLTNFQASVKEIMKELVLKGHLACNDMKFLKYALPRLIRTSYLSADFLSDSQVIKIDKIVHYIFDREWVLISKGWESMNFTEYKLNIPFHNPTIDMKIVNKRIFLKLDQIESDSFVFKLILFPKEATR